MDTTSIITGIALVAVIALPFFLYHLIKRKKEKKFLNDIISLAESENATISQIEFWRERYAIGIDNTSKKLFYINKQKGKKDRTIVDLSEIEKCRIVTASRSVKTPNGNSTIIDRLELVFTFNSSDVPEKVLEFYDCTEFMTTDGEVPLIEKWQGLVNSNLKTSKK
jgi:hypothetical protein